MFNLHGKNVVVTGATGGIGKEMATLFKRAGANVTGSGSREKALQELEQELGIQTIVCDLSSHEARSNLIEKVEELYGAVDILICNAGITIDNLAMRMKNEQWSKVIDLNLSATFALNQAAIKKMSRRKAGRIINISSVVAYTGNIGQANYTASKAGIVGMSKSLAIEVATRGITVNCIAPGFIKTKMTDTLGDKIMDKIMQNIPMGYVGEPKDVANAALFLAADESSYITGQVLHVNGGMFMA